jgi:GGDEF domain-containing protein
MRPEARPETPSWPHDAMQRHLHAFRGVASLDVCLYTPSACVTARSRTPDAASRRAARARSPAGPLATFESTPLVVDSHETRITLSVGVSVIDGSLPIREVIQRADTALYQAKASGRNCTVMAE